MDLFLACLMILIGIGCLVITVCNIGSLIKGGLPRPGFTFIATTVFAGLAFFLLFGGVNLL